MNNKGQGISINVIIVAAIALIVLVVLIAIFTGRIGIWGQEIDDAGSIDTCSDAGGSWKTSCGTDEKASNAFYKDAKDHPTEECCIADDSS